jgi:hypothetical protein
MVIDASRVINYDCNHVYSTGHRYELLKEATVNMDSLKIRKIC